MNLVLDEVKEAMTGKHTVNTDRMALLSVSQTKKATSSTASSA